jgi:hypothetical protein
VSRRTLLSLLAIVAVLLAGACEVRSQVGVSVDEDGSGTVDVTVRLDGEAARRLGDPATALRTDDLVAAGWTVQEPAAAEDGLVLEARRSFASPEDLPGVLDELGGVDGVFRDVRLEIDDGFARTEYAFSARVELTGSPEQFGDAALTEALGGLPLARTPEELAFSGAADPSAMTLEVAVELPGGDPDTNGDVRDGAAVWSFPVTGGEPTSAELSSTATVESDTTRIMVLVGVGGLLVAAGLAAVGVLRRRA